MKLRRPCEHGRYERHHIIADHADHIAAQFVPCPGGVFLPDDTLVIEKSEQGVREGYERLVRWMVELELAEFHDCAKFTEHSLVLRASDNARLKCEWVLPDALSVREAE